MINRMRNSFVTITTDLYTKYDVLVVSYILDSVRVMDYNTTYVVVEIHDKSLVFQIINFSEVLYENF